MFVCIKRVVYQNHRHVNRPHKGMGYPGVLQKKIVPQELVRLVLQLVNV